VDRLKLPEMTRRNQVIIAIALLIIAIPSYFIYDYTQNNPKFCTTCHLMNTAYETWDISAMHDLNCHECHESDMVESLGHVVEVLTENPQHVTKVTEVDNELCEECHASNDRRWRQVASTAGHEVHFFERDQPPDCIECHGLRLHVFEPPEEICMECHDKETRMDTPEIEMHCLDCHEFTDRLLFPEKEDCINCHDFARLQAIMDESIHQSVRVETDCFSCHNPHEERKFVDCESCHDTGGLGLHDNTSHTSCELCHTPHSLTGMRDNCLTCHLDRGEHYSQADCHLCHSFGS
jgi:hypothetical protein